MLPFGQEGRKHNCPYLQGLKERRNPCVYSPFAVPMQVIPLARRLHMSVSQMGEHQRQRFPSVIPSTMGALKAKRHPYI